MGNEKNSTTSKVSDTDTYVHMLYLSNFLRELIIPSAIEVLQLPPGSLWLDAGCWIGSHTLLLAEAVAPAGHVTGLDLSPEFLVHARQIAERSGLSEQVSFREGDLNNLPFDDDTFDCVCGQLLDQRHRIFSGAPHLLWPGPQAVHTPHPIEGIVIEGKFVQIPLPKGNLFRQAGPLCNLPSVNQKLGR